MYSTACKGRYHAPELWVRRIITKMKKADMNPIMPQMALRSHSFLITWHRRYSTYADPARNSKVIRQRCRIFKRSTL